jgi:hypothetical protein
MREEERCHLYFKIKILLEFNKKSVLVAVRVAQFLVFESWFHPTH